MNGATVVFSLLPWILVVFPSCILGALICIVITPFYFLQVKISKDCNIFRRPAYFILGVVVLVDFFCDAALFVDASDRRASLDVVRLFLSLALLTLAIVSSIPFGLGQLLCLHEFEIQQVEVLYSVSYAIIGPFCACYSRLRFALERKVSFAVKAATLWDFVLLSNCSYPYTLTVEVFLHLFSQ